MRTLGQVVYGGDSRKQWSEKVQLGRDVSHILGRVFSKQVPALVTGDLGDSMEHIPQNMPSSLGTRELECLATTLTKAFTLIALAFPFLLQVCS